MQDEYTVAMAKYKEEHKDDPKAFETPFLAYTHPNTNLTSRSDDEAKKSPKKKAATKAPAKPKAAKTAPAKGQTTLNFKVGPSLALFPLLPHRSLLQSKEYISDSDDADAL